MNGRKTLKQARALCNKQLRIGRKVLRAKTRKQALALMKTVPHATPDVIESGLTWWDRVQFLDPTAVAALIKEKESIMRANCIEKYRN